MRHSEKHFCSTYSDSCSHSLLLSHTLTCPWQGLIETMALENEIQGITLLDCFVIADEIQHACLELVKQLALRYGPHEREPDYDGVKIVFCGDPQQMGTKQRPKKNQKKSKSGKSLGKVPTLQEFVNNIVQEPDESFQAVLLTKRDIKRGGGRAIKAVYARFEKIGL